jgi:hypothetical protein
MARRPPLERAVGQLLTRRLVIGRRTRPPGIWRQGLHAPAAERELALREHDGGGRVGFGVHEHERHAHSKVGPEDPPGLR